MSSSQNTEEKPSEYIRLEAELLFRSSAREKDEPAPKRTGMAGAILILAPLPYAAKEIALELQNGLGRGVTVLWGESPPDIDHFSETQQAGLILYKPKLGLFGMIQRSQKAKPGKTLYKYSRVVLLQRTGSTVTDWILHSGRASHLFKAIDRLCKVHA